MEVKQILNLITLQCLLLLLVCVPAAVVRVCLLDVASRHCARERRGLRDLFVLLHL